MRRLIALILRQQAKRFIRRFKPRIIVVTGSVGKTSTTQAIATVLAESFRVRATLKNYNTDVGVPCSIFAEELPGSLKNPLAWLMLLLRNERALWAPHSTIDTLVLELGTDKPGEIAEFAWLQPDNAIVTAVAGEHMESFKTLDAVAAEELSVAHFSQNVWLNDRMIKDKYLNELQHSSIERYNRDQLKNFDLKGSDLQVIGAHSFDAVVAALSIGRAYDMDDDALKQGAKKITPRPGRMQQLKGTYQTTLIDDTYNASPVAMMAALDYLYSVKAPQRIALLGNMNELGDISEYEHTHVGDYCSSTKLDLVVTLGPHANRFTAPAARAKSCTVIETTSPYEAAEVIREHMKKGAYILFKGSQNGVFAEEAVKKLLKDPDHAQKLVRQNDFWLQIKSRQFPKK